MDANGPRNETQGGDQQKIETDFQVIKAMICMIMCKKYILIIFVLPCVTENCQIAVNRLSNNTKNAPNPRHTVSGINSIKRETDIFKQSLKFYSTDDLLTLIKCHFKIYLFYSFFNPNFRDTFVHNYNILKVHTFHVKRQNINEVDFSTNFII